MPVVGSRPTAVPDDRPQPARRQPGTRVTGPVRGLMVDRVAVGVALDPWLTLRALADYSGLSRRKLQALLVVPVERAIPCYRIGSNVLVRRSEFDLWMEQHRARGRPELVQALREMGLDKVPV